MRTALRLWAKSKGTPGLRSVTWIKWRPYSVSTGSEVCPFCIAKAAERLGETKLAPWRVGVENLVWLGLMRAGMERQAKALLRPRPRKFDKSAAVPGTPAASTPPDSPTTNVH